MPASPLPGAAQPSPWFAGVCSVFLEAVVQCVGTAPRLLPRDRCQFSPQFGPSHIQPEIQTWEMSFSQHPPLGPGRCPLWRGLLRPVVSRPPQVLFLPLIL